MPGYAIYEWLLAYPGLKKLNQDKELQPKVINFVLQNLLFITTQ